MNRLFFPLLTLLMALLAVASVCGAQTGDEDESAFDDTVLDHSVRYPGWFRLSFLNLRDDLEDVAAFDKSGLVVYFGQEYCPYCKALIEGNFGKQDIAQYTKRRFDVVAIDIHGSKTVVDLGGKELSEKTYAAREKVNFTPTLIFYDKAGCEALRLNGFYPPYQFRAALEYVADAHYREESFADYLQRADPPLSFEPGGMNEDELFVAPPYALDRSRMTADMPLAVFFEQGDCHACDVLHSAPLENPEIRELLKRFESVQLDIRANTAVIMPSGERTTSREWARKLGLFYTPTLIFFDKQGKEALRVDSVVGFYRLRKALEYVLDDAHNQGMTLIEYRRSRGEE